MGVYYNNFILVNSLNVSGECEYYNLCKSYKDQLNIPGKGNTAPLVVFTIDFKVHDTA